MVLFCFSFTKEQKTADSLVRGSKIQTKDFNTHANVQRRGGRGTNLWSDIFFFFTGQEFLASLSSHTVSCTPTPFQRIKLAYDGNARTQSLIPSAH